MYMYVHCVLKTWQLVTRDASRNLSSHVFVRPWQNKKIVSEAQWPPFLQAGLTDLDEIWHDGVAGLKQFWWTLVHFFGEQNFLIVLN